MTDTPSEKVYKYVVGTGLPEMIWGSTYRWTMDADLWLPRSPLDVDERVYVELGEREFSRYGDNTQPLDEFVAELQEIAAKAPKGSEVVIELGTEGDDDSYAATYEIGYWRNPTKKERAEREETNRKIAERDERKVAEKAQREREEYERLKAKFND